MDQLVSLSIVLTVYTTPIATVADAPQVNQQQYADDTQLIVAFTKLTTAAQTHNLDNCIVALEARIAFAKNNLAFKVHKTELIQLSTNQVIKVK